MSRSLRVALLVLCILTVSVGLGAPAWAHDRDVATFSLQPMTARADGVEARGWVLQVHVARHALDAALVDGPPERVDPKGWRARAVAYVKQHVQLTHDGQPLALSSGGIRVGGHQTDLRFLVPGLPAEGAQLVVQIDAFAEDGHQSNVLKLRGAERRTVVLVADDDYTAEITVKR